MSRRAFSKTVEHRERVSAPAREKAARRPESMAANGATLALLRARTTEPGRVHAKTPVGSPDDPQEAEADRAASNAAGGVPATGLAETSGAGGLPADPDFAWRLGAAEPLPEGVRDRLEPAFGQDLGSVRLHVDSNASHTASALGARALAFGEDIAFARGEFDPGSRSGMELIAHEVAHVVQHRGGDAAVRRELLAYPGFFEDEGTPARALYESLLDRFAQGVFGDDRAAFREVVLEGLDEVADVWSDASGKAELRRVAGEILDVKVPGTDGTEHDVFDILGGLGALDAQAGMDVFSSAGSLGTDLFVRSVSEHAAVELLQVISPVADADLYRIGARFSYAAELARGLDAITSPEARYRLELEGTLLALLEARQESLGANPSDQPAIGERRANLARRVLMLNAAIEGLRAGTSSPPAGALDAQLRAVMGRIAEIRASATSEEAGLAAMGGGAELLASTTISSLDIETPQLEGRRLVVNPDEAFAATTDRATLGMLRSTASTVEKARREVDELHDRLLPPDPQYTLEELALAYHRWFAFFSPMRERVDPLLQMYLAFFDPVALLQATGRADRMTDEEYREALENTRTPYELTGTPMHSISGSGLLSTASEVSGAYARMMMLDLFVPMIRGRLQSADMSFGSELGALEPRRSFTAGGRASSPYLELRGGFRVGTEEMVGPARTALLMSEETSRRYTEVRRNPSTGPGANAADLLRLLGPRAARLPAPDLPLFGLREVTAAEGWSYLVDVYDPHDPMAELKGREHRVMPPDVAEYLAARRRFTAMTSQAFIPRVDGRPIGDVFTRAQGLEAAHATSEAVLMGRDRTVSPDVIEARTTLASARVPTRRPSFVSELHTFVDTWFQTRTDPEWRIAGVLVIGNEEHQIGRNFREAFSPEHILKVAAYAYAIGLGSAALSSLGRPGQILARGINAYLGRNGCTSIASVAGIYRFLRGAADAEELLDARAWAYVSRPIVGDLSNLVDDVVSRAATRTAQATFDAVRNRITGASTATPRELIRSMGEIARDPAAREPMLRAIESELADMRAAGRDNTPEFRALAAMRVEILGMTSPDPAINRALDEPLTGTRPVEDVTREHGFDTPRTDAERAALDAAVPAAMRGRVRVVENPLLSGSTVHVVPGRTEVQIQVGRGATPADVATHLDTARDMARFVGPLGRVRELIDRARSFLQGRMASGTRGREAEREIEKLNRMIEDLEARREWIERRATDLDASGRAMSDRERAEIDRRIESLENQIALHARDLGSMEAGRGFVAAVDSRATVRDALMRAGRSRSDADAFLRTAGDAGRIDALAQLVSVGTFGRLTSAGVTAEQINDILSKPDGYSALVNADLDPGHSSARRLLGRPAADELARRRTAAVDVDLRTSAADRLADEWGVDPASGRFAASRLPRRMTVTEIERLARLSTPPSEDLPRIVFRRWRYVQRVGARRARRFQDWAEAGYGANVNREASSPFAAAAIAARDAFSNDAATSVGGQRTYDYGEWVTGAGRYIRSGAEPGRPRGAEDYYDATTRPDGIRPRPGGGFDVVEHKHLTGDTTVLDDSIQLRAQREMARVEGRDGVHELVLSSDRPIPPGGVPPVRPSRTVGSAPNSRVFYFDGPSGRITHVWDADTGTWETHP